MWLIQKRQTHLSQLGIQSGKRRRRRRSNANNATLREVMTIIAKSTTVTATALVVVEEDGSGRFYVFCASSARTHYWRKIYLFSSETKVKRRERERDWERELFIERRTGVNCREKMFCATKKEFLLLMVTTANNKWGVCARADRRLLLLLLLLQRFSLYLLVVCFLI